MEETVPKYIRSCIIDFCCHGGGSAVNHDDDFVVNRGGLSLVMIYQD